MKKYIPIALILILIVCIIGYKVDSNKKKDISYVTEKHFTSGILNKNRLNTVETMAIVYSDDKLAIVEVTGKSIKNPSIKKKFKSLLEKDYKGLWKVKKVYSY